MPPYQTQAPDEVQDLPSPVSSVMDDMISLESPSLSDIDVISNSTSSDSEDTDPSLLAVPTYEKIRIPLEQNLKELLIKVTETENLESVTSIKLRVIARDFSLQRLPMYITHLTELNLDGSCLMSLRDLGCDLDSLTILRVSRCGLNSLDGLFGLQTLVELYAGYNQIGDLSPCAVLPDIETLDLRNNTIKDISSVTFLSLCTTLKHITLSECPTTEIPEYRQIVQDLLPDLITLDGVAFTIDEIKNAGKKNTYLERKMSIASRLPLIQAPSTSNEGENLRPVQMKKRPHTTGSVVNSNKGVRLPPIRPSTARQAKPSDFASIIDASDFSLNDIRNFLTPSRLTSGNIFCGNLALALKERRTFQAWND